jgi:hypothetical protein
VRAVFDQPAAPRCAEFPGGVSVQVNGQRLAATSRDACVSAIIRGAR